MFEVVLSAFVIGIIFTEFSTFSYFTDPMFYKYLLNALGWIHYDLPGVFLDAPAYRAVNLQLWTVPFELECYLALTLAAVFGLHRRPIAFLLMTAMLTAAVVLYVGLADRLTIIDSRPPGKMIVLCFLFGVALFLLKDRIRIGLGAFVAALAIYALLIYNEYGIMLAPLFIAYATVYLGILNKRLPLVGPLANYSYGIYLFGFPMQQVVYQLLPDYRVWWVNFILSILLTLPVAAISWHLIEKPINDNKKSIIQWIRAGRDGAVARFVRIPGYRQARNLLGM